MHSSIIYVQLACGVVVFVLDARVRKIESITAVFEFLDYKKSYVKYISHELHTPLNAATLGLNMAIIQMNKHKKDHLVDNELVETLSGIRLACNAAVNSLNDFLFSGRVESGILEVCLETTPVVNFVSEAINIDLLFEQARAKRVVLDILFQVDATVLARYPSAVPLRSYDCLSCDRSKMDQVLQKLVNNAIKFSEDGGTITIRAFFCASLDESPTASSVIADDDNGRQRPLTMAESIEKSERSKLLMTEYRPGNNATIIGVPRNNQIFTSTKSDGSEDALIVASGDVLLNGFSSKTNHPTTTHAAVSGDGTTIERRSGHGHGHDISNPINSGSRPSPSPSDVDGYLVVTVSDTGPGVSEVHKKTLFRGVSDRHIHHHSDNNNNNNNTDSNGIGIPSLGMSGRSGSGFGLFISRCIVDLHGGNPPLDQTITSTLPLWAFSSSIFTSYLFSSMLSLLHASVVFERSLSLTYPLPYLLPCLLRYPYRPVTGSMGVSSAREGHGSTFTLSIPMTRKRGSDRERDRDNHHLRNTILGGFHFQPSLHSQQQQPMQPTTDRISNTANENELVDMKDVFQSRFEGDRDDDHARFGTVNGFNINTVLSRVRGTGGSHANGTRRAYRHYPQHNRHPARRSFTFVKDLVPAAAADVDDDGFNGDGIIEESRRGSGAPSLQDDDGYSAQEPLHFTLPLTSHHIQMMDHLQPQASDGSAVAPSAGSQRHSTYQLLLLDDSNLLCTALRIDGHRCDEAKDASTAMAMINEKLRYHRLHGSADKSQFSVNNHSVAGGGGKATSDDDGGDGDGGDGDGDGMYDAVIIAARDGPSICKSIRALSAKVAIFGVTNTVFFREESRLFKANGATSVLVKPFDMAFFMDFLRQMEKLAMDKQSKKQQGMMVHEH